MVDPGLKPCPFCGGRPIVNLSNPRPLIYCEGCEACGGDWGTLEDACVHWNTRAATDDYSEGVKEPPEGG